MMSIIHPMGPHLDKLVQCTEIGICLGLRCMFLFFNPHLRICLLIFLEREGERKREKHGRERQTSIGYLLYTPPNWESNSQPLVCGTTLQAAEPPSQDLKCALCASLHALLQAYI